ncbi:uncharacterized protein DNG_00258 [Cephalotrichum gorgonifer]|uniref:Glutaredoxin-like protein n=1 Tax=Cephalotrichum gorgonifer TaxID=2041049 RepID=A0AAE8SQL4_9PEZI|nr:uncharacterized protein DNG_00258 [Cephalotrichum gorgonifer]
MRLTGPLRQAARVTLFTRPNCGLCDSAKTVLSGLRARRPFPYREVDISGPGPEAKGWKDLYDFDVPVIHVSKSSAPEEVPGAASRAVKLMHRFTEDEVEAKMKAVEELD